MKKLFISLCIILFTISCTNEEETNNYTPVDIKAIPHQKSSCKNVTLVYLECGRKKQPKESRQEHPSPMLQTSLDALMQ